MMGRDPAGIRRRLWIRGRFGIGAASLMLGVCRGAIRLARQQGASDMTGIQLRAAEIEPSPRNMHSRQYPPERKGLQASGYGANAPCNAIPMASCHRDGRVSYWCPTTCRWVTSDTITRQAFKCLPADEQARVRRHLVAHGVYLDDDDLPIGRVYSMAEVCANIRGNGL